MSDMVSSIIVPYLPLLITLYITLNIIGFFLFGFDKYQSIRKKVRIPENALLAIAILGGALGGFLGMRIFRHKTLHLEFSLGLPFILFLQGIVFLIAIICIVT